MRLVEASQDPSWRPLGSLSLVSKGIHPVSSVTPTAGRGRHPRERAACVGDRRGVRVGKEGLSFSSGSLAFFFLCTNKVNMDPVSAGRMPSSP